MSASELEHQATLLRNSGQGYQAVKLYQQAKQAYQNAGDLAKAAGCQHMIGVSFKIENDIKNALPAYELAVADYQKAGNVLGAGRVWRDVGIMYEYHDQLKQAQEFLAKSQGVLQAAKSDQPIAKAGTEEISNRDSELGMTLAKIGLLQIRLGRLKSAEDNLVKGLELIRQTGHPHYEATALLHLASLYFATKHYAQMLANLEAALGVIYEFGLNHMHPRRLAQIRGLMAHAYLKLGNQRLAKHFAGQALDYIKTLSPSAQRPVLKDINAGELSWLI